jgi:hydroxymethylpyrimidine pyrophosphatase-like HAD family hydrolase
MLQGGRLIKLMIFDVDDTLAKRNEPIGDGVVRFLKMAESAGIRVAMISGKPMMYVVGLARQVGLANPILSGENGAHIQYSTVIPPEREIALAASANSAEEFSVLRTEISRVFGDDVWFQPNSVNLSVFPLKEKRTFRAVQSASMTIQLVLRSFPLVWTRVVLWRALGNSKVLRSQKS